MILYRKGDAAGLRALASAATDADERSALEWTSLRADAHPIVTFADRPVEHVTHAEFPAYPLHIDHAALVGESRAPGDHEQPPDAGKSGDDLLHHAVGKVLLFRVLANIGEWEDRDGRFIG